MNNKRILITGCSTGIGFHTAIYMKQQGYYVIATVRDENSKQILEQYDIQVEILDITNQKQQQQVFKKIEKEGQLEAVFFNAGFGLICAVEDTPKEALIEQFDTNVFGTWDGVVEALKIFRKQGYGKIIVNSSVLGYSTMAFRGPYSATKFALEAMCDTLRQELYGTNISVSLMCPGPIHSQFRSTALKKFNQYIGTKESYFKNNYTTQMSRLKHNKSSNKYTLEAIECSKLLYKIISSKKPKARYPITFPAKLFLILKRLLPTYLLDRIYAKASQIHYDTKPK